MQPCQNLAVALQRRYGLVIYLRMHFAHHSKRLPPRQHPWPCQQPATHHHPFQHRPLPHHCRHLLHRMQVAVIHYRLPASLHKPSEGIPVQHAFILLLAQSGMHRHMLQRHLIQYRHQPQAFFRILLSQPHLDRKLYFPPLPHLLANSRHSLHISQQSASPASLHLHGERASHIQVHPPPACRLHSVAQPRKLLAVAGYHLRHRRHPVVAFSI